MGQTDRQTRRRAVLSLRSVVRFATGLIATRAFRGGNSRNLEKNEPSSKESPPPSSRATDRSRQSGIPGKRLGTPRPKFTRNKAYLPFPRASTLVALLAKMRHETLGVVTKDRRDA